MLRIHKQDEIRRFCEEVGFRRLDRATRASEFLARRFSQRNLCPLVNTPQCACRAADIGTHPACLVLARLWRRPQGLRRLHKIS